jgi:aerobic-type carbon monoxide dehydrogenase small subunit (CoxS/CutS family)
VNTLKKYIKKDLRLQNFRQGVPFQVEVDGQVVEAYPGETVATVLLACGKRVFHFAPDGSPRSYSCGVGRCFSCLVMVDDVANVRACQMLCRQGMKIQTGLREADRQ